MTTPKITNSIPERLDIRTEVFRKMLDAFGADMRNACPGIIQSFDETKQTVTVQLAIKEKSPAKREKSRLGRNIFKYQFLFFFFEPDLAGGDVFAVFVDKRD